MSEKEKYFYSDFKDIRESKNITIEDIVKKTRIQIQYIHAIENGNFEDLPSVYIRLFLKSYCKVIGIDEHKILIQYNDYIKGNRTNTNNSNNINRQQQQQLQMQQRQLQQIRQQQLMVLQRDLMFRYNNSQNMKKISTGPE